MEIHSRAEHVGIDDKDLLAFWTTYFYSLTHQLTSQLFSILDFRFVPDKCSKDHNNIYRAKTPRAQSDGSRSVIPSVTFDCHPERSEGSIG
jgi:hypothetical protein